ncbi:ATP-dependent helicase [Candidatus Saccharibacteria bacterium]|nr:ATP-dependent helicase [Candidatus Saccharibacteria bacterium]
MNFDEEYQKLNPAQAAAVDQIDGTVMVIAGPGTGKTQLLAMRVANILKKTDTGPGSILCLTFTESAATNMTERMAQIFGADAYRVAVHTFHSFGSEIIGRYPEYFYDGAVFQPAGELTTLEILDEILSDLAHDNPLTATMNGGWTYLSELARTISDFKKAGLAPSEVSQLLTQNLAFTAGITPLLRKIFSDKITLATVEAAGELLQTAEKAMAETPRLPFSTEPTLAEIFTHSLARHLGEAKTTNKTKPLTEWKKLWTTKNPHGELILKDDKLSQKLLFASEVYAKYTDAMTARGFYDFDDMILRVIAAIEKNPDLRAELQETFQYVLVDEFQDTNDAQMRLLRTLTDYDDNPNLLVVGDDDQAIYRFQGADISNIRQFATRFPTLTVISLSENYRSGAAILDLAGNVVSQISERLTSADGSAKQLVKKVNFASKVRRISTATREAEYDFIAQEIRQLLDTGVDPSEIAVISRNHKQLERLLPFLAAQNIAIDYERRRDVLGSEPIQQLINLGLVAEAIARGVPAVIDEYLPQVLAHPAWQIAAFDLWQISLNAHEKRLNWLDALSAEPKFAPLVAWLQTVAQLSQNEPLENILDELIGFASPASPAWCETFSSSDPSVSETSYTGAPAEPSLRTNLSGTSG